MGRSAAGRLRKITFAELQGMLIENADEPHAEAIARAVISNINKGIEITTTTQLRNIIRRVLKNIPHITEDEINKSCQRCFQALRIDINKEFEMLENFWKNFRTRSPQADALLYSPSTPAKTAL